MRNDLLTRHHRLLRLEETVRKRKIKLTDEQIQALERFDPEYRERHIKVGATGELVAVDTFFAGTLKGVGKVYIQTVLDCFSRYVWARLYTWKMPLTAVQILNNHALTFFEEHGVRVQTILSDNGRECCGRPDKHPYELFLQLEEIEHRTTKVGRPQSTWYETVAEMQKDLDAYLKTYNRQRPHRRRGMKGRTPYDVFKAGIPKKSPARKKTSRNGGQDRSVDPDLGEAGWQVNTVLVQRDSEWSLADGRLTAQTNVAPLPLQPGELTNHVVQRPFHPHLDFFRRLGAMDMCIPRRFLPPSSCTGKVYPAHSPLRHHIPGLLGSCGLGAKVPRLGLLQSAF